MKPVNWSAIYRITGRLSMLFAGIFLVLALKYNNLVFLAASAMYIFIWFALLHTGNEDQ